ncbi:KEOPS complex subunit Pcc1, partial [Halorubrum sp. AJ67]|uniref:KEOPS complex subunit Pcc1 n=1 Tax=Halorubrum sp. AJ67 TaxID=1173487 RepID=UPI00064F1ECF
DSMRTRVDGDVVACTVARPTTGELQSTLDDHLVNLRVADRVIERGRAHLGNDSADTADSTHRSDSTDEPQTTDTDTPTDT